MHILISRTDSIGDVVLTLPVAAALKKAIPGCTVIFLGREYTRAVAERCSNIDDFVSFESLFPPSGRGLPFPTPDAILHVFPVKEICRAAKVTGIPLRIATSRRWFTWFTCNRLLHIPRKNSDLHESQLNLEMLRGLGIRDRYTLDDIPGMYGLKKKEKTGATGLAPPPDQEKKYHVILHPKSKGSAREWGLENFGRLIGLLPPDRVSISVTGTRDEGALMKPFLEKYAPVINDLTGRLTLDELMDLIASADALVAASTGPLHLAAAFGIHAIGLYAPMRPIFPKRWAPIGMNAQFLVLDKNCSDCRNGGECLCIKSISPEKVAELLVKNL